VKIKRNQLKELIRQSIIELSEGDDDKYTHIGYGRYKKKGQEKKPGAPTFKKTDDGDYEPFKGGDDVGGPAHANIPKKEPKKPTKTTKISKDPFADKEEKPTYTHKGGDKLKTLKVRKPEKPSGEPDKPKRKPVKVSYSKHRSDTKGSVWKGSSGRMAASHGYTGQKTGFDKEEGAEAWASGVFDTPEEAEKYGAKKYKEKWAAVRAKEAEEEKAMKAISAELDKVKDKPKAKKKLFGKIKSMFGMGESVHESVGRKRRCTVKEVKKWFKTLEENRYKKTYASDARRVSWLVNNNLSEDYESMPKSMRKKWSKAAYGRERFLAKEFVKHLMTKQITEQRLRKVIRKIIIKEMRG